MGRQMDKQTVIRMDKQMVQQMDKQMALPTVRLMDRRMARRMDRRMAKLADKQNNLYNAWKNANSFLMKHAHSVHNNAKTLRVEK